MKTIATFWRPDDAHLLRLRLEAAGFNAVLQDENITQIHPLRAAAIGGVRVQVEDAEFDAVQIFLGRTNGPLTANEPNSGTGGLECLSCQAPIPDEESRCPACGWSYNDAPESEDRREGK